MKPLSEMDHYEILEIHRDASQEVIEQAYRVARSTWAEDSLATYSVLDPQDSGQVLERVEIAYRVLSDSEARRSYDASLNGEVDALPAAHLGIPPMEEEGARLDAPGRPSSPAAISSFDAVGEEAEGEDFDGAGLRRERLLRGLDIERISSVTKISSTYLRFLEDERYEDLPAAVYVRGFVIAFARSMGLDPELAASGYMERYRTWEVTRKTGAAPGRVGSSS